MRIDFLLAFFVALITSHAHAQQPREQLTRDVIIRVAAEKDAQELARMHDMRLRALMPRAGIYLLIANDRTRVSTVLASLKQQIERGTLLAVEQDRLLPHVFHDFAVPPNDPRYGGQWYLDRIDIEDAWRIHAGDPSTSIVVIDDGCDLSHPDLVGNLQQGYDALDDDDDATYSQGDGEEHGTACAGLAAATTNNNEGIAGTCPQCGLRCVRLLPGGSGLTPESADIAAFNFALEQNAAVVSNSWGFDQGVRTPTMLRTAIETVMRDGHNGHGAVVVFAAGNDARDIASTEISAVEGVINVGAINNFDEAASFSNFGDSLWLTAPTGTLTTDPQGADGADPGNYSSTFGGTSSSAPIVAGAAALVMSYAPTLTSAEVRDLLRATARRAPFATPDDQGHDKTYGYGIVDPAAALRSLMPAAPDGGVVDASVADAGAPDDGDDGGCAVAARSTHAKATHIWLFFGLVLLVSRRRAKRALLALGMIFGAGCTTQTQAVGASAQELRPDSTGSAELPPRYESTDVVESIVSEGGAFRIHFTRAGMHAVPNADTDSSGTPDYVELVASTYDDVLAHYVSLGYRTPRSDADVPSDNGGDGLFDVYLLDFAHSADGAYRREICDSTHGCAGYMLQENDFTGYGYPSLTLAVRLLASHEFFHAVQAAYDNEDSTQGSVLSEGTAVWASDTFDATLGDIERFSDAYLERTDRSLGVDPIGAVQSFSYGSSLFFRALTDIHDQAVVRLLWERMQTEHAQGWPTVLDRVLTESYASSFSEVFTEFSRRNLYTGTYADPTHSYSFGARIARVTTTEATLPFHDTTVRLAPASARYYSLDNPSAGSVRISLPLTAGDYAAMSVLIAHAQNGDIVNLEAFEASASFQFDVDADDDEIVFALVDGRVSGDSSRFALCVSDATQEDPCGGTVAADAGVTESDAGANVADGGGGTDGDGGCAVSHAQSASNQGVWIVLALSLSLSILSRSASRRSRKPVSSGRIATATFKS